MKALLPILIILGVVALVAGVIYLQVSVWRECRVDHSFWYCVNLVSRK